MKRCIVCGLKVSDGRRNCYGECPGCAEEAELCAQEAI